MSNRSNPKWNSNKANYTLEVDLTNVKINENREFGKAVQQVSGRIHIILSDSESGNDVSTDFELEDFTEMGKDPIRRKILSQIQPKIVSIIRDLLSGLD